jgi:hypothetical protein
MRKEEQKRNERKKKRTLEICWSSPAQLHNNNQTEFQASDPYSYVSIHSRQTHHMHDPVDVWQTPMHRARLLNAPHTRHEMHPLDQEIRGSMRAMLTFSEALKKL